MPATCRRHLGRGLARVRVVMHRRGRCCGRAVPVVAGPRRRAVARPSTLLTPPPLSSRLRGRCRPAWVVVVGERAAQVACGPARVVGIGPARAVSARGPAIVHGGADRPAEVGGGPARMVRGEQAAPAAGRPGRVVGVGPVLAVAAGRPWWAGALGGQLDGPPYGGLWPPAPGAPPPGPAASPGALAGQLAGSGYGEPGPPAPAAPPPGPAVPSEMSAARPRTQSLPGRPPWGASAGARFPSPARRRLRTTRPPVLCPGPRGPGPPRRPPGP